MHPVPGCGSWCCCIGCLVVAAGPRIRRGGLVAERPRAAVLAVVEGAAPPGVELALFDAMLAGWQRQQQSRRLSPEFVRRRERVVRRCAVFTGGWAGGWAPGAREGGGGRGGGAPWPGRC